MYIFNCVYTYCCKNSCYIIQLIFAFVFFFFILFIRNNTYYYYGINCSNILIKVLF